MIAPLELLDTSIAQIRTLTAFLHEQLGVRSGGAESETAESRACHELLAYLMAAILRHEAAGPEIYGGLGFADHVAARMPRTEANDRRSLDQEDRNDPGSNISAHGANRCAAEPALSGRVHRSPARFERI